MALQNMIQELLGVPGVSRGLAVTKINEAFMAIQNEQVWSFQLKDGGFLTPGLLGYPGRHFNGNGNGYGEGGYGEGGYGIGDRNRDRDRHRGYEGTDGIPSPRFLSPGTISIEPYTNKLYGDEVATRAWSARILTPPFITQYQFRVPYYSLYSAIELQYADTIAYVDVTSPGSGQVPGTYVLNGQGGTGTGAQISVVVNGNGTITEKPFIINPGSGYTPGDGLPTFSLETGGYGAGGYGAGGYGVGTGITATFSAGLNAVIILDRPWMEPRQYHSGYMAYQAYFAAPPGFKRWWTVRDTTNNNAMDWWTKTEIDLAQDDAERTIFDQPFFVVPYQMDTRPGSATYGQMLFELWPGPITELPYSFSCQANWPPLIKPTDTVPYPLTEEVVKLRALEMLALWKESQKGDEMERGSGANWQFLTGAYRAEYANRLKECRNMDRHLVDLYFTKARLTPPYGGEPFSTVNGLLNVGTF